MPIKIARAAGGLAMLAAAQAGAQAPPAAKPTPEYTTASASAEVARPIAAVMAKTAGWCAITVWAKLPCRITSGRDGELGAVRLIADRITEVFVAKTATSYTYAAPLAPNMYHGTVEYLPVDGGRGTRVVYTVFFDLAVHADAAAKQKEVAARQATVRRFADAIKAAAEG